MEVTTLQQNGPIILLVLVCIIAIVLCAQNTQAVAFQLFAFKTEMSMSILMAGSFFLGLIPLFGFKLVKQQKTAIAKDKEAEWDKQDEKLKQEIGSDHVKQLEAKIETLNAALSAALKKNK